MLLTLLQSHRKNNATEEKKKQESIGDHISYGTNGNGYKEDKNKKKTHRERI